MTGRRGRRSRSTLSTRTLGLLLGPLVGLTTLTGFAVPSPTATGDEPFCTPPPGSGLDVNEWQGPMSGGTWNDDANWSDGAPDEGSGDQLVCIDVDGSVTMPAQAGIEVHAAALDVAGTTLLDIEEGNGLFVNGDQSEVTSTARAGTTLRLRGGSLGGNGRLEVAGRFEWTSPSPSAVSRLVSRPCASGPGDPVSCPGPAGPGDQRGVLAILTGARAVVDGSRVALQDQFRIEVAGLLRLGGPAATVAADRGTRLTILPGGILSLRNNGGWYAGRNRFGLPRSVIVNRGTIAKTGGSGTSTLFATFPRGQAGEIRVRTGRVALPDGVTSRVVVNPGRAYASGRCGRTAAAFTYGCRPVTDPDDLQTALVRMPTTNPVPARARLTEGPRSVAGFGREFRIVVTGLTADRAHPALLQLRYDSTLRGTRTATDVAVLRQHGAGSFQRLGPCTSANRVPAGAAACVDRAGPERSRVLAGGDLLMVVRTIDFSRWVAR